MGRGDKIPLVRQAAKSGRVVWRPAGWRGSFQNCFPTSRRRFGFGGNQLGVASVTSAAGSVEPVGDRPGLTDRSRGSSITATLDRTKCRRRTFPPCRCHNHRPDDVLLALGKFDPVIEKLPGKDGALPDSRFPVIYDTDEPFEILLPHLAAVKRYTQVLQLRAIAELQSGQNEKALDDVKLMLRLIDSVRTEPFLISHLVRLAIVNLALQPVWEGLTGHKWSDAQLVALNAELAKLDFPADYKLSMRGELGCQGRHL